MHHSIIWMFEMASAQDASDTALTLVPSCRSFLNAESKGIAKQELYHQFTELRLLDVALAEGTVQALYHGKFLYSNSSTPSNFAIFAFNECSPLSTE